ncbi:MAG: type II secretion system protein M [Verrucomicrobia bacterium]|nr:type II secretion system protein M [Verrucomicrobiota bacterium]
MSPREKKLIVLFSSAGFLVVNLLGLGVLKDKQGQAEIRLGQARQQLETAKLVQASREQVAGEIEWLAQHEPAPAANQDVQTQLQQLCESAAKEQSLEIKSQKPLPSDTTAGRHYHRAKIEITLTGPEQALYKWFDQLNSPELFRGATRINLSPNKDDDSKIDCKAIIEQWFVPLVAEG